MKKKKLLHRIFVIPSLIVLLSLLAVFLLFQVISDQYINALTSDALKNEMNNLGNITFDTNDSVENINDELADTSLIVPVMHLVIDNKGKLVFPASPWYYEYEVKIAKTIYDIIADEPDSYKDSPRKLNVNDNFYLVQAKNYMGIMEDGTFIPDDSDKNSENYYVLFYINIICFPAKAMSRIGRAPHPFHGFFFLPDTDGEETAVNQSLFFHFRSLIHATMISSAEGANVCSIVAYSSRAPVVHSWKR